MSNINFPSNTWNKLRFELRHIWGITKERGTTAISKSTDYTCNDCQKCACGQKGIHVSIKHIQPLSTCSVSPQRHMHKPQAPKSHEEIFLKIIDFEAPPLEFSVLCI